MNIKLAGLAVLVAAAVSGCGKQGGAEEDSMAFSVNGVKLMKSEIDANVEKIIAAQGGKIPADRQEYARQMFANQLVQGFIVEQVLAGKAKSEGYAATDADRKAREEEFLKATAGNPDAPKSMEDYFKQYPLGEERARAEFENGIIIDKLIKAEQAKAPKEDFAAEAKRRIDNVISNNAAAKVSDAESLKKIKELKAQLDKTAAADLPKRFAELAKANSACPSAREGGGLGEFTRGQMVKEFDQVAFTLPENKVSDPVKTQFGYHLVLVTKKIPAVEAKGDAPAAPEKVQASHILLKAAAERPVPTADEVVKSLERQHANKFVQDYVQSLMKSAKLEAAEEFKHFLPPTDEPPAPAPADDADKK